MKGNLTIVTALFDIGRGELGSGFNRPFDHYVECFIRLLKVDYPMVIFCEKSLEDTIWQYRKRDNTRLIFKTLDDLRSFPFYTQIQKIRTDPSWYGQAGWLADSTQASLELYNPLVMSKQFFLNDASLFNFFDTKYFLWVDAGIANTLSVESYFNSELERRIIPYLNKMLYLCFPYDGTVEVHGFAKGAMDSYAGEETKFVARGGIFGGSKDSINKVNEIYYSLLHDTLNNGYMGTEESLFTIMAYRNRDLFNTYMIEPNGLVYKFFHDIFQQPLKVSNVEEVAIYALTFNLPQQFEMWVESFKRAYPSDFKKFKKYVINNSNDPSVNDSYQRLFKENGFEEFKFDNIGINGARHFAAEHFEKSDHEFMIFFEDDMLLHHDPSVRCKSGFTTYHESLFDKAIDIVRSEGLDYLKLSFSEFYGDNFDNWGWYNVPADKKSIYFPTRTDGVSEKKTRIDYTGVHRGLPFAVGEYHYCNWPIIFTKNGNRKIFLEEVYVHKYEQTWMSLTMSLLYEKKIKAGCLLASPINHHRQYHYDGSKRRENEHYKN